MKKFKILLLLFISSFILNAQDVAWLNTVGSTGFDSASIITTDNDDNIYTVGTFRETIDIDPGAGVFELNPVSTLGESEYIQKLDSNGDFLWGIALGTTEYFDIHDINVADNGTVYIVGVFSQTIDLNPGTGEFIANSEGLRDGFILVLNSDGSFNNAHTLGSIENDFSNSVTIAANGSIIITGFALDTVDFDPGSGIENISADQGYVYVLTLSSAFEFIDVFSYGGVNSIISLDILLDSNGDKIISGYFTGTADFDPGSATFELTSTGQNDIFVAKYSGTNQLIWAKNIGNGDTNQSYRDVHLDSENNILITGAYGGTLDFDPGNDLFEITSMGGSDIFILKLDENGIFVWAKGLGNPDEFIPDSAFSVTSNSQDDVIVSGKFTGTVDFDTGEDTYNLTSNGYKDIFLMSLNADGNFLNAYSMGGTNLDAGVTVTLDSQDAILLGGTFRDIADLNPGLGINNVTSNGDADAFVMKLNNLILETKNNTISTSEIFAYPNPSNGIVTLKIPNTSSAADVQIFNVMGQVVFSGTFPQGENIEVMLPEAQGVYLCKVHIDKASKTLRLIKN